MFCVIYVLKALSCLFDTSSSSQTLRRTARVYYAYFSCLSGNDSDLAAVHASSGVTQDQKIDVSPSVPQFASSTVQNRGVRDARAKKGEGKTDLTKAKVDQGKRKCIRRR
jgi:hypothetical protein